MLHLSELGVFQMRVPMDKLEGDSKKMHFGGLGFSVQVLGTASIYK